MTRKDYKLIAKILREVLTDVPALQPPWGNHWGYILDHHKNIIRGLNTAFMEENPRFDADRFWEASNLEDPYMDDDLEF